MNHWEWLQNGWRVDRERSAEYLRRRREQSRLASVARTILGQVQP